MSHINLFAFLKILFVVVFREIRLLPTVNDTDSILTLVPSIGVLINSQETSNIWKATGRDINHKLAKIVTGFLKKTIASNKISL